MSTAVISTKGQLTIPQDIRRRMNLGEGDRVEVQFQEGAIKITHANPAPVRHSLKVKIDKETGFPYFDVPKTAQTEITNEWVAEQLADFP